MQVKISNRARRDILEQVRWLGKHCPGYGERATTRSSLRFEICAPSPGTHGDCARSAQVTVNHHAILYHVEDTLVVLDRVAYASRNLKKLAVRKGTGGSERLK